MVETQFEQPCENGKRPTPTSARVIMLANDVGLNYHAIFSKAGVPVSTVRDIVASSSARQTGTNRQGRPLLLTSEQVDKVISFIKNNFEHRALPWKNLVAECGLECSPVTLKRALTDRGYHKCVACPKPFISESACQQRLVFITEHSSWSWEWEVVLGATNACSTLASNGKQWWCAPTRSATA
jgi:transposase